MIADNRFFAIFIDFYLFVGSNYLKLL